MGFVDGQSKGRVVLVCGAKGGVGTTSVAANLAAVLADERDTALLALPGVPVDDLALWFAGRAAEGDGARPALKPVAAAGAPELLAAAAERIGERLDLFRPEDSAWTEAQLAGLLRLLRARYAWVIADAGAPRGAEALTRARWAAGEAAAILIVTGDDPLALRRARDLAEALDGAAGRARLVPNRCAADGAWRAAAGGVAALGTVGESPLVPEALLRGVPVVWADPRSATTAEFVRLADALPEPPGAAAPEPAAGEGAYHGEAYRVLKRRLHRRLLDAWRDRGVGARTPDAGAVRADLLALLEAEGVPDATPGFRERLLKEVADGVLGLGPLQDLLDDPEITEVMVNGPNAIYVEKAGRLHAVARALDGTEELRGLIERIVAPLGRRIDESSPLVDARLPDGSRVNAIIPPLALNGPCLTIRKFARKRLTFDDLLAQGSLTPAAAAFLRAAVAGKLNLLISGGTGTGKTTLLNIVAGCIGGDERIVTIEDAAELSLPQEHVVSLEARPANLEGKGAVTIRDLVRNALRMRPDRIVVGECRGGEALDMLQAMNTGHEGSLTTLHANSPRDALSRLETMVLMAGLELPLRAIRDQVAGALDLIVQISRLKSGARLITSIAEVQGMEGDVYRMQDVFRRAGDGPLAPAGLLPRVVEKLAERGHVLPPDLFAP